MPVELCSATWLLILIDVWRQVVLDDAAENQKGLPPYLADVGRRQVPKEV